MIFANLAGAVLLLCVILRLWEATREASSFLKENTDVRSIEILKSSLSISDKKKIIKECTNVSAWVYGILKKNLHASVIEKDFWVCILLDFLFNKSQHAQHMKFKGGTSLKGTDLSKGLEEEINDVILERLSVHS